jgi:hypothetical protein
LLLPLFAPEPVELLELDPVPPELLLLFVLLDELELEPDWIAPLPEAEPLPLTEPLPLRELLPDDDGVCTLLFVLVLLEP